MEWVETTAKSVDDAKELALDQLGVTADEAEFEVLEEPRPGLFGRVRGEARVRARVRPTTPRAKVERRDRRKGKADSKSDAGTGAAANGNGDTSNDGADSFVVPDAVEATGETAPAAPKERAPRSSARRSPSKPKAAPAVAEASPRDATTSTGGSDVSAQQVGEEAARFLDGLAEAFGLEASSSVTTEGDEIEVKLDGADVGMLIGQRGATLLAIQDLTRVVAQRRLGDHETRLRIDIGGYRERRRAALSRFTLEQAEAVKTSGKARVLEPMPSADRKVIHDTVAGIDGVSSRSEGDDPHRRVVIVPDAAGASDGE